MPPKEKEEKQVQVEPDPLNVAKLWAKTAVERYLDMEPTHAHSAAQIAIAWATIAAAERGA